MLIRLISLVRLIDFSVVLRHAREYFANGEDTLVCDGLQNLSVSK